VLVGTGRYASNGEPAYWLPTIPEVEGATGGQVVALATGAAYLAFDSSLYFSSDGGNTWFPERWTPWSPRPGSSPLWTPGVDFWLDLPMAPRHDGLPVLWYDERRDAAPSVYLAHWKERSGWDRARQIPLATATGLSVEEALVTERGKWLLFGPCRGRALDALVVEADGTMRRPAIPLELVEGR
jgi:hypothetical protein